MAAAIIALLFDMENFAPLFPLSSTQYRHLYRLREALHDVPFLALTATATPKVLCGLGLGHSRIIGAACFFATTALGIPQPSPYKQGNFLIRGLLTRLPPAARCGVTL